MGIFKKTAGAMKTGCFSTDVSVDGRVHAEPRGGARSLLIKASGAGFEDRRAFPGRRRNAIL
jgi:hypothetical protein